MNKFLALVLLCSASSANAVIAVCDNEKKDQVQTIPVTIGLGGKVEVYGDEMPGAGYRWTSKEKLESETVASGPAVGGPARVKFKILGNMVPSKKTFTFYYGRPFADQVDATCKVQVTKRKPKQGGGGGRDKGGNR